MGKQGLWRPPKQQQGDSTSCGMEEPEGGDSIIRVQELRLPIRVWGHGGSSQQS